MSEPKMGDISYVGNQVLRARAKGDEKPRVSERATKYEKPKKRERAKGLLAVRLRQAQVCRVLLKNEAGGSPQIKRTSEKRKWKTKPD